MQKTIIVFLLVFLSLSCGDRKTSSKVIKGKSRIVFNGIDKSLNEKVSISGYVYSKHSSEVIEQAHVKIQDEVFLTDKNGFFSALIEPGVHTISTNFIGNDEEKISNLKVSKNNRIVIIFELGSSVILCH